MDIAYSGDAFHTYMVINGGEGHDNEDEEKMMSNQTSSVLLHFQIEQCDDHKNYCYDISGRLEFGSYIEKKQADEKLVRSVIQLILGLNQTVEEYLLDPDGLLLQPECMYLEISDETLQVAYIPGRKEDFWRQLKQLTAWLLENACHGDKEGVLLVYDLYKLVQQENFLPMQLQALLEEKMSEENKLQEEDNERIEEEEGVIESVPDKAENVQKPEAKKKIIGVIAKIGLAIFFIGAYVMGWTQVVIDKWQLPFSSEKLTIVILAGLGCMLLYTFIQKRWDGKKELKKEDQDRKELFEGGSVYSFTDASIDDDDKWGEDKTVLLSGKEGQVRLISLDKSVSQDLIIDQFPCFIGSLKAENTCIISAVGVSRRHAKIEKTEKGIYLTDLASTNGTSVNGEKLKRNEKRRLMVEDIIEFASVRYMYC